MLRLLYVMAGLAFLLASAGVAGTGAAEAPKSRERVLFVVDSTSDMGVLFGGSRKLAAFSGTCSRGSSVFEGSVPIGREIVFPICSAYATT